jgi:hypothetical protein
MSVLPIQQGGLRVLSGIVPASSASTYGTHYSYLGVGGYVEVPTVDDRNSIPADSNMNDEGYSTGRRRYGMMVYVIDEDKLYRLFPYSGSGVVSLETFTASTELEQVTMLSNDDGWTVVPDLSVLITGGTYFSGSSSIVLYDSTGGTVSITGITTTDIINPGDGRILVSTGNSENTFVAQSNMIFTGSTLSITGGTVISTTGTTIHPSAILHLDSKTKGLLFPVLTTAEKNAIANPTSGLTVYDSTLEDLSVYTSSGWTGVIAERDNLQKVTERGNTTNRGLRISGTTYIVGTGSTTGDTFVTSNSASTQTFTIKDNGNILIGTTTDSGYKLNVNGDAIINGIRVGLGGGSVSSNTVVGFEAGLNNTSGTAIVAVGYQSLRANTTGSDNTSLGWESLKSNTSGGSNVAVGRSSLTSNTSGLNNTAVGRSAMYFNTGGSSNVAMGTTSLFVNVTGSFNTAIGRESLFYNTTSYNTAVGYQAGYANTSGNITAFGYQAGYGNTTGSDNAAFGYQSLYTNSSGNFLTSFGTFALQNNTTGSKNTAFGSNTLKSNTTGIENVGVGQDTLRQNTTANYNTAVGNGALYSNNGSNNTAIGYQAGYAGTPNTGGTNNIFIGYQSTGVSATESNRTWIGNSSTTSTWLAGNVLIGTTTDGGDKLYVNGSTSINGNLKILNNQGLTFYNGDSIFASHYFTTSNEVLTVTSNNTYGAWKFNNYAVSIGKALAVGTTLPDYTNPSQTFLVVGSSILKGSLVSSGVTTLSGSTTIIGSGTTSGSTALSIKNLTGGTMVTVNNGGYVGIGTTTPTRQLEIVQAQLGDGSLDGFFVRDSSNIQANFAIKGGTGASSPRIMVSSLSDSLGGGIGGTGLIVNYVDNNNFYPLRFLGSRVDFETTSSSYGSRTTIMRANPTGVLIGTTTDSGYMLDVNGTTRIRGANLDFINTSANFKLGYSTSKYTTFEAVSDGATKVSVNGVVKFFIGASSLSGIEIPSDYAITFVNPGVVTYSNVNWNLANNQFEFKNGNKSLFADVMVGNFTTTGTTRMLGSGSTSGSTILTLQNSLSATTAQFRSDGVIGISSATTFTTQGTVVISATSQNSGIAIVPNGSGFFSLDIPDGSGGGNARGVNSVDLQMARTNVNQVASGYYNFVWGYSNRTTGYFSTAGGDSCVSTDTSTWAFGTSSTASADHSMVFGRDCINGSQFSIISGGRSNITQGYAYTVIAGGQSNTVSASYASIGGGQSNTNLQTHSTIVGGWLNANSGGAYSIIGGGRSNFLGSGSWYTFIGSGWLNGITGDYSVIVGGFSNSATTQYAAVIGGSTNRSSGLYSLTHGLGNTASSSGSTAIGYYNTASGAYSVVMGSGNTISSNYATIAGGQSNTISSTYGFIGGGQGNTISVNNHQSIMGGRNNVASGEFSSVMGGDTNTSSAIHTATFGYRNTASNSRALAGGYFSSAVGLNSVAIGYYTYAGGNYSCSFGSLTRAESTYGFAIGAYSQTNLYGQHSISSESFGGYGDSQQSLLTSRAVSATTSGSTITLSLDGTGVTNLITPYGNNRAWNVVVNTITVCTVVSGGTLTVGDAHSGEYKFLFKRVGGTSTISPITTSSEVADTSMATSSYTFSAGTSQQLAIVFNAPNTANNSTFRAVAKVQLVEVAW